MPISYPEGGGGREDGEAGHGQRDKKLFSSFPDLILTFWPSAIMGQFQAVESKLKPPTVKLELPRFWTKLVIVKNPLTKITQNTKIWSNWKYKYKMADLGLLQMRIVVKMGFTVYVERYGFKSFLVPDFKQFLSMRF